MPFFPHLQYTLLLLILPPKFLNVVTLLPFTIHFATINTNNPVQNIAVSVAFTIHFATINTNELSYEERDAEEFTIHFATINTKTEYTLVKEKHLFTIHPCVKYWIHIFFKFPIHFPLLF